MLSENLLPSDFWLKLTRALRWKVNLGWVLEKTSYPLVIGAFGATIALLLIRYYSPLFQVGWGIYGILGVIFLALIIGFLRARPSFESRSSILVRLETHLGLNAQLTSAQQGVCDWPAPAKEVTLPLKWNLQSLALPLLGLLILGGAALWLPIPEKQQRLPIAAPRAWQQLNQQLNELEEEELVDQEYVKEMKEQLEQLQAQAEEEWYQHSSLEAGEALAQEHQKEVQQLGEATGEVQDALEALSQAGGGSLTNEQKQELQEQLNQAAEAMEQNQLKPNEELRDLLKKAGAVEYDGLSPEEMEELKEQMKSLNEQAKKQSGNGGEGEGDGQASSRPGNGERKDPTDPQNFPDEEEDGPTNRELGTEAEKYKAQVEMGLKSKDLSRSVPGELIDVSQGEHEADLSSTTQSAGGETSNVGTGGGTTYQSNYLPEEKRALKNFFK